MTLPTIGTTDGAQAANLSVAAMADVNGNITFVGPSGIQGSTITCVVTVPSATSESVFSGVLGTVGGQGIIVDTWGGSATGGQFQVAVGQTLVVTGTNLKPNTAYTCTFATITDVGNVQVVIPEPNSSAELALLVNSGIAGNGIESAATALCAPQAQVTLLEPTYPFQMWSWGWLPATFTNPTVGNANVTFAEAVTDSVSIGEGGSNRLAGIHLPNTSPPGVFSNNFDQPVYFYMNYSP